VRKQESADNGEIVAAAIDNEAVVKRLRNEPDGVFLDPENPAYEPIDAKRARILGKVVGVLRLYKHQ